MEFTPLTPLSRGDQCPVLTVRGKYAVKPSQIDTEPGYQGGKTGDKIQRGSLGHPTRPKVFSSVINRRSYCESFRNLLVLIFSYHHPIPNPQSPIPA